MCGPQSPEASEGPSITADLGHSLLSHYRAVMFYKDSSGHPFHVQMLSYFTTRDCVSIGKIPQLNDESKSTPYAL